MKQSLMFQVSERVIRSLTGKHSKVRKSVLCEIKKKKTKKYMLCHVTTFPLPTERTKWQQMYNSCSSAREAGSHTGPSSLSLTKVSKKFFSVTLMTHSASSFLFREEYCPFA